MGREGCRPASRRPRNSRSRAAASATARGPDSGFTVASDNAVRPAAPAELPSPPLASGPAGGGRATAWCLGARLSCALTGERAFAGTADSVQVNEEVNFGPITARDRFCREGAGLLEDRDPSSECRRRNVEDLLEVSIAEGVCLAFVESDGFEDQEEKEGIPAQLLDAALPVSEETREIVMDWPGEGWLRGEACSAWTQVSGRA